MSWFEIVTLIILAMIAAELRAIRKVQTARWEYDRLKIYFGLLPDTTANSTGFACAIRQPLEKPYALPDTLPKPHEWLQNPKAKD